MDIDRDALNTRWHAIEARLNQLSAASCLDQEVCRAEVEDLLAEQDRIESVLDKSDGTPDRWSGDA